MIGFLRTPAEGFSAASSFGLRLRATRAVTVVLKGKAHDVLTNAATVRGLLSAMGIEPDGNDRVAPPLQTPLARAPLIRFARVDVRRVTVVGAIPFAVTTTVSHDIAPGSVRVLRDGRAGRLARTYGERFVDGRLVSRRLLSSVVKAQPVDELREVGAPAPTKKPQPPPPSPPPAPAPSGPHWRVGPASWYDHPGLTAASPWLPFGTKVKVTNLSNGRTVTVVINDRGPFGGRIIDLSREAFADIAPLGEGVVRVRISW